ncbi:hypothetical protein IW261DRAFT_1422805 [Armillaria novae-zelandiae]|uniref:Uncharacterized protein n=1 Tax=Armillaria novae-zelandiae TaxID=153914 RepID=A0AA39NYZ7_9AGAR|nr:hypothetical protein IW261DRAFT_1422805 [Armillaria novae-zelandiae]
MLFALFKFIKLVFYIFVVLGPAHYYLLFLSKDQSNKNIVINLFSYTAMWTIALGEVDFGHQCRPDGQTSLVVLALHWWIRDTITATFLGVIIAVLLRNLTHTSSTPEIHSPLLPSFFDALSCANHSCANIGEVEPSSYRTVSAVLTDVAECAWEADDALNNLLLKLPSAVATMDIEVSERRHHPISMLDISQMIISDFMMGDAVPREFSPSMLMALGGWNVLVMDARVALPVEAFRDQARCHGGKLSLELRGLLKTMEHIPRRVTSKILVCTEGDMSNLQEKVKRVKQGIIVDGPLNDNILYDSSNMSEISPTLTMQQLRGLPHPEHAICGEV